MKQILLLFIASAFIWSCKKDDSGTPAKTERQRILEEYTANYLGSAVTDIGWTGNTTSCNAGTISADAMAKTLQRINYFRKMAGVSYDITFDPEKNAKCQQAALMMHANNTLSHTPPETWSCYTPEGATAAGNSNIAMGANSSAAISLYMEDPGTANAAAGHRRWILYSRSHIMGAGSTTSFHALWVIGGFVTPDTLPEFIAWPPKGYVPAPMVFSKWTFSIPSADFSSASVSMTDGSGVAITCNIISKNATAYGDNTLVWEPAGINTHSMADISYHITLNNVMVGGDSRNYAYDVVLIQPE